MEIRDDGRGFDPEAVVPAENGESGIGLVGMRARLRLLGGRLEIERTGRPDHCEGDTAAPGFRWPIGLETASCATPRARVVPPARMTEGGRAGGDHDPVMASWDDAGGLLRQPLSAFAGS